MKIKAERAYKITFWAFVIITIMCYAWSLYSLIKAIVQLF